MSQKVRMTDLLRNARFALSLIALMQFSFLGPFASRAQAHDKKQHGERSPVKHLIIIVGENRTFDHVFATYKAKHGQRVDNLLSKGIVKEDGTPGPNYWIAHQYFSDVTGSSTFELSPKNKTLYAALPAPLNGGPTDVCINNKVCDLGDATSSEQFGLATTPTNYYEFMTMGGTGLAGKVPDTRISGVHGSAPYSTLPPGPFQLTNSTGPNTFTNDSYAASPVHRFYQMWQQMDCEAAQASVRNPSGCKADLFTWTEVTVGSNVNGVQQPADFRTDYSPTATTTGEGATAMGFYNVLQGDNPYFKYLADNFAMSDNYHQPVMGGTGANSVVLGFADAIWFSDADGNPARPPHKETVWADTPLDTGTVDEIENPNPQPGTNNWWMQDGYGGGGFGSSVYGGGSYSDCSDVNQPGVGSIVEYLKALPMPIKPNCESGHYYLLNNYNPGYFGDGSNAYTDHYVYNTPFTIPPTKQPSIADVMNRNNVSWKYYGDQWNEYLTDKYQLNYGTAGPNSDQYCNICNPFQYQTSVMTDDDVRTAHLKDTEDLFADINSGSLPAVSYVKPSGWVDGHPASSKMDLFEGFVKSIVDRVHSNKELWESTAILVTVDEGGGYYDSGYVQPLDFFGDGTRIPLMVVSPYTRAGYVSHNYTDHASIIKFIERNWNLPTISNRSRDNYPNPRTHSNPYIPVNSPAIGDLFDLFDFDHGGPEKD
jgi:phospholipase C